jgi:hypothetical protein
VRVKIRVAHLRARLGQLVDLGSWPESITMSHISELNSSLDSIIQYVTSLEGEQDYVDLQDHAGSSKEGDVAEGVVLILQYILKKLCV